MVGVERDPSIMNKSVDVCVCEDDDGERVESSGPKVRYASRCRKTLGTGGISISRKLFTVHATDLSAIVPQEPLAAAYNLPGASS